VIEKHARNEGTSTHGSNAPDWNPIEELTQRELTLVERTGQMPVRLGAEIEHSRIPQRVVTLLEQAGLSTPEARALGKLGDPSNLELTHKDIHGFLDQVAQRFGRNTGAAALDDRAEFPLASATNAELTAIVDTIRAKGIDLGQTPSGRELREILRREKQRRSGRASDWTVP